jgi:lipopolysaccharide transport system ATP-binding protein
MSDCAIRVEQLSKKYEITVQSRHDTLRDQIADGLKSLFRGNGRSRRQMESFWALKDVSFEVKPGDVVGVIGRNGAGKSTLLKILSRITVPSSGSAEIHGRVGSLLEVGTGFHPELTGRENIFFNGAILGMKKAEIARKFDDMVAFAEVEKFIDTPVKRYSSGMYIRLAFAVAAHFEPEVLIVDEVLAVGDTAFQKKCLGKMEGVAKQGRTVLFVSHNMAAIQHLCNRVLVLVGGRLSFAGGTREGIEHYFQTMAGGQVSQNRIEVDLRSHPSRPPNYKPVLQALQFFNGSGKPLAGAIKVGAPLKVAIRFHTDAPIHNVEGCIGFETLTGQRVFTAHTAFEPNSGASDCVGERTYICEIPSLTLVAGIYRILVALGSSGEIADIVEDAAHLEVIESDYYGTGKSPWNGLIVLEHHWRLH